jgi:hypothetical protein
MGVLGEENPAPAAKLREQLKIFRLLWEVVVVRFNEPPVQPELKRDPATEITVAEERVFYAADRSQNSYLSAA